jgi:hypothetical protein
MLTQYTTTANQYLKELVNISSDVAELLIKYLCESGKLNTSTLGKVANHWYVT